MNAIKAAKVSSSKGTISYENADAFTQNNAHGGKATGFGSATFGIPDMSSNNSFSAGAPGPVASGSGSFAQGIVTNASGMGAMATGEKTEASGKASFTAGKESKASADYAFAAGKNAQATAEAAVALGQDITADEAGSVVVGGPAGKPFKVSNGSDLFTVDNQGTGEFTKDVKVKGKGEISDTLKVGSTGNFGGVVSAPAFAPGGGDYAEYFQWEDLNPNEEDRRHLFVTLEGDKIRLAQFNDDFVLGIVSVNPSIIADAGGGRYNNPQWAMIGLLGKLILQDDGTCEINGWCYPKENGIGSKCNHRTQFRVMKRLDKNHVKVLVLR